MTPTESKTLEGYKEDARGRLIPLAMIKDIDLERDSLVHEIVKSAMAVASKIKDFKIAAMADVGAFVELSAEKYDAKIGGAKGNVQLTSFDGEFKVCRDIADMLTFDERLQAAKSLIDECLREWSEGAVPELCVLVNDAFQVDKQGNISTARVLGLRRLPIDHIKWKLAMEAVSDSLQVVGTKPYLRIYQRQDDGSYQLVNLDLASV